MARLDENGIAPERLRPLRRREFDKLVELGLFDEDERLELLHGQLIVMNPPGPEHASLVNRFNRALTRLLGERALVSVQNPLAASDESEPEPDLAVVPENAYQHGHPATAFLIIEIADSSLTKDREVKSAIYAAMDVPEYWVVDLRAKVIERYLDPAEGAYRTCTHHASGALTLRCFPDVSVSLDELLR